MISIHEMTQAALSGNPEHETPSWPDNGTADVWRFDIDMLLPYAEQRLTWFSDAEIHRLERCATQYARTTFLAGRCALRATLSGYLQMLPNRICFVENAYGKPMLAHSRLKFNLSHSGTCLLIVVSCCDVGIDVQVRSHQRTMDALFSCLAPKEAAAVLASVKGEERYAALLRCWSRKEALSKAIGLGLQLPPSSYAVPTDAQCVGYMVGVPGHANWWIYALPAPENGQAAMAASSPINTIRFYQNEVIPNCCV